MKLSVNNFKKIFTSSWIEYFLLLLTFVFLMKLGFWQVHRAQEKISILKQYEAQKEQPFTEWTPDKNPPNAYQNIKVKGEVFANRFYLDNQFYQHRLGYHVIVPVRMKNKIVLLDMGWIPATPNRRSLPHPHLNEQTYWQGTVYFPPVSKLNYFQHWIERREGNHVIIESLEPELIAKELKAPVYPWILRLRADEHSPQWQRDWTWINVRPEKHYAYAGQWFLMALIVIIILIWRIVHYEK